MLKARHLKTDSGRDAAEQVIIDSGRGTKAFISFGKVIAITSALRPTVVNTDYWDSNQTTLKYFKRFLGKDEYSKQEVKLYLNMSHFKHVSNDVIATLWELETDQM